MLASVKTGWHSINTNQQFVILAVSPVAASSVGPASLFGKSESTKVPNPQPLFEQRSDISGHLHDRCGFTYSNAPPSAQPCVTTPMWTLSIFNSVTTKAWSTWGSYFPGSSRPCHRPQRSSCSSNTWPPEVTYAWRASTCVRGGIRRCCYVTSMLWNRMPR